MSVQAGSDTLALNRTITLTQPYANPGPQGQLVLSILLNAHGCEEGRRVAGAPFVAASRLLETAAMLCLKP